MYEGIVLLYVSGIVVYYAMYCTVDQCVRSNKGRRGKGLFGNEEVYYSGTSSTEVAVVVA